MSIVLFGIYLFSFAVMIIVHFVKDESISKPNRSVLFIGAVLAAAISGLTLIFSL